MSENRRGPMGHGHGRGMHGEKGRRTLKVPWQSCSGTWDGISSGLS